jgi:hypothetical protein
MADEAKLIGRPFGSKKAHLTVGSPVVDHLAVTNDPVTYRAHRQGWPRRALR